MKFRLIATVLAVLMVCAVSAVSAQEAVNVGNKICPVGGEKVGEMGEAYEVEHEGKIYNLCCMMCAKDFKKDPQKYIDMINDELEASGESESHAGHNH